MRVLVLCAMLLGCSDRVDGCSNAGSGDPCVTFHLTGEPVLAEAWIDAVQMWVTYTVSATLRNQTVKTPMAAPTHFPIAVGLDLPVGLSGAARVRIAALTGPGFAAYAVVSVSPSGGQHLDQDVQMNVQSVSGCFNNTRNNTESDVDCGSDCPPCAVGRHCFVDGDCLTANCAVGSDLCE
jgi:hypothetical protein